MKKNIFILLTVFFLLSLTTISFAEKEVEIFYNGEKIDFATSPIEKDNTLMVPMRQFFESFDANVNWINDTQEVLTYKGNTFIKLKINDSVCYNNGKKTNLTSPPIIVDDRTLVPVEFVAKTFDMDLNWNEDKTILNINNKYRENIYSYLGSTFFKKYYLKNEGIEFSLPAGWENTSTNKYSFSLYDGLQNYTLSISSGFLNEMSLDDYISNIQSQIEKNNSNEIVFSDIKNSTINDIPFKIIHLNTNIQDQSENNKKNILYFFKYNNKVHLFNFSYSGSIQDEDAIGLTNIIINSLKISTLTINREKEHYLEYKNFFKYKINLDTELHANKDISNNFDFVGSLEDETIKSFNVIVEKNGHKKIFIVPVIDKHFNTKIYTPFGLGKHNITIIINNETEKDYNNQSIITMNKPDSNVLMQFSIVNLNSENILYLLPSEKVLSSNETLLSAAKLISIDQTNSYDKVKILYEWIFNNIALINENTESNEMKNALEVFNSSSGTNIEINFLFSSLIRSLDIPSRIIRRLDTEETVYYQTEIYINGKWITTDIYSELMNRENIKYSNFEYFNIYDQNYFDKFILKDTENYQILQY